MKYRISKYCKLQSISRGTVYNWEKRGIISLETDKQGRVWVIDNDSLNDQKEEKDKCIVIYLKVGSYRKQSLFNDQEKRMTEYCNSRGYKISRVIKEVASIFSPSPKLLDLLLDRTVDIIVTETSGNITLFGNTLIEKLLGQQGRKLEIVNQSSPFNVDERKKYIESLFQWGCEEIYGKRKAGEVMKDISAVLEKHKP